MRVLTYVYGARDPLELGEVIQQQLRYAHDYKNAIKDCELLRRQEYHKILAKMSPEYTDISSKIVELHAQNDQIREAIRKRAVVLRSKAKATAEESQLQRSLNTQVANLRAALKKVELNARKEPTIKAALDELAERHTSRRKDAYNTSEAIWGSKVAGANDLKDIHKGPPPKLQRFCGEGRISVQIQKGDTAENICSAKNTQIQLHIYPNKRVSTSKKEYLPQKADLRFRVGSNGRNPIFALVPIVMHRPLPVGSLIKFAHLHAMKIADRTEWRLLLQVVVPQTNRKPAIDKSLVAVHVGWRMVGQDVRVATWLGSDGQTGTLKIPFEGIRQRKKVDELQAIRDNEFNAKKDWLMDWIDERKSDLPEFLTTARKHMHAWKQQSRLVSLLYQWRANRFEGDEEPYLTLYGDYRVAQDGWRRWDKHLWQWQKNQMVKFVRRRLDFYRRFAAQLAGQYERVCVMAADWAELKKRPEIGQEDELNAQIRYMGNLTAVGNLESTILSAFGSDCAVGIPIAGLTTICGFCGHDNVDVMDRSRVKHTCSQCGAQYDIDENAVKSQLARALVATEELPSFDSLMSERLMLNSRPPEISKQQQARLAARKTLKERKEKKEENK